MAKSRQTKKKRTGYGKGRSTAQPSNGPDEAFTNIETAENEFDNVPDSDARPSQSPDETIAEDNPPGIDADIVFQCGSCRSIVGDTLSEYQAHLEFEALSLKAASNVSIEKELHISKNGFDTGCTYRKIVCSQCGSHLGRTYTSTTVELDSLRSAYTFSHTALVSYQLGSSKTMDGQYAPNREKHGNNQEEKLGAAPYGVAPEAFDALDAHVGTLTDVTNKLTEAFNQNKNSISETKESLESTNESLGELRAGLEHVQNMLLLWEERFQRLDACEQGLTKLASDGRRYDLCERRLSQLEEIVRNSNTARTRVPIDRPQTAPMKVIPPLRKSSSSPARSSLKRRR